MCVFVHMGRFCQDNLIFVTHISQLQYIAIMVQLNKNLCKLTLYKLNEFGALTYNLGCN